MNVPSSLDSGLLGDTVCYGSEIQSELTIEMWNVFFPSDAIVAFGFAWNFGTSGWDTPPYVGPST